MDVSPSLEDLASVEEAVRAGRMIEAIKLYREATGVGLAEAKAAVDRIAAEFAPVAFDERPPRPIQPSSGCLGLILAALALSSLVVL